MQREAEILKERSPGRAAAGGVQLHSSHTGGEGGRRDWEVVGLPAGKQMWACLVDALLQWEI